MTLRQSMAGLHTWGGLLPSWLLFVILFAGTLACFDKELERWMRPALHVPAAGSVTADQVRGWLEANVDQKLHAYWLHPPTDREPFWKLGWQEDATGAFGKVAFDPRTGRPMPETVGGEFFFTLHYNLQADTVGMYIVGLAGMFMLVALVSGIIVHRRLFKDFFTLRPQANGQRAWLDAHNLFGVIGLPFHLVLAYTGVAVFVASYMPAGAQVAYGGDPLAFFHEVQGGYHRDELDQPAARPVSLDRLIADARQRWGGGEPGWVIVEHPFDASAVVSIRHLDPTRIGSPQDTLSYDATTGALLDRQHAPASYEAYIWLVGLHMAQFGGAWVRILYGLLGLAGCAMLVAGTQVWLRKREARGQRGLALVRTLNHGVFFGLPIASLALLWANRLLPDAMEGRASAEAWVFSLAWLATACLAGAMNRSQRAAKRSCWVLLAVLALGLPPLNLLIAPHGHLLASLTRGDLVLASVDLLLVLLGVVAIWQCRAAPAGSQASARPLRVREVSP